MTAVYGTLRSQASNVTFAAVSGGSLTGSGTLYFCAQLRSRAGLNLPTTPVSISYTTGQRISVTIASTAVSAAEAGSAHEVVISAATTNDVTQMQRLASYSLLQADQITQVTLPQTFYLSQPAHIALASVVANPAALPTGSSLIQGMVRQITSLSANYYKYDATATAGDIAASPGYWSLYYPWIGAGNGFTTYIGTATDNPGGCDYPLQSVGSDALPLPAYNPASGASTPLRVAIENGLAEDGGNSIEALSPIGMIVEANGIPLSAAFNGAIDVTYLGLARKSTGALDTSDSNVGVNKTVTLYAGAANAQQNAQGNATLSSYATTNLVFPQAVPRGYFALFSIRFNAQANKVAQFVNGEDITAYFDSVGDVGEYSALAEAIGDTVLRYSDLPTDGYLRILPASNSIVSQPGLGVFQGYIARRAGTRSATLSVADTSGQKVAIAGTSNGQIIVRQPSDTLLPTEALRAKVSTASGTADATAVGAAFSSAISVGASGTINVTLTYPTGIRGNYPDVIAGTAAPYNVPRLKVYLKIGGVITEQSALITVVPGGGTQNIVISTNSGSTVSALPTNADPAFCLFNAPSTLNSAGTGGSLAAGSYQYAVVPHFPTGNTQATAISHKVSDGCVPEILTDLATAIGGAHGYTTLALPFNQPPVGSSVVATVRETDIFSVNQPVFVAGGGGYLLQSLTATTITLLREIDNGSSYASTGSPVAADSKVAPGGRNGLTGATGPINGLRYTFSNATSGTPATGALLLNNATPGSATTIRLSETDRLGGTTSNLLSALTNGSLLQLTSDSDQSVYHWYTYASQVDNGSDRTLTVSYLFGIGTLSNLSNVSLGLVLAGPQGVTGATGTAATISVGTVTGLAAGVTPTITNTGSSSAAVFNFGIPAGATGATGLTGATGADGSPGFGVRYSFSTSTATTPASGQLRFNNATITSVTAIYISETDRNSTAIASVLDQLTVGSVLLVTKELANTSSYAYFTLTGITDNGSDRTLAVTYSSSGSGSFSASDNISLMASIKGATGPTGSPGTVSATSAIGLTQVSSAPSGSAATITLFDLNGVLSWLVNTATTVYKAAALNLSQSFTASQSVTPVTITISAGNANTDASLSNNFTILPGASFTLTNPTNLSDGQTLVYKIKPSANGVAITYGSKFKFPTGASKVLTGSSGSRDRLTCAYDATDDVLDCVLSNGFG